MPSLVFLNKDPRLTVGSQIEILVFRNKNLDPGARSVDLTDERRSGNFVILAKRHIIDVVNQKHNVSLEIGKVSERGKQE